MSNEVGELFDQARSLPHGASRVAALETAMRHSDAQGVDPYLRFEIRFDMIWSYISAGERARSFVPFAWCLSEYDRDPQRYSQFGFQLLWAYKWQPDGLIQFPEIPLARTQELLDDMERRYRLGGHSLFPVHQLRLQVARHVGDAEAAAKHYRDWEVSTPDSLADCAGCWPSAKVRYLIDVGRHDDAIRVAEPVLAGAFTCDDQPQAMLTALLPAYVATGREEEAAAAFRKAYRADRNQRSELDRIGRDVEFLARTGNELTALEVVEDHLGFLESPPSPRSAMIFQAAAARALTLLDPGYTIGRGEARPVHEVAAEMARAARDLARRFDERNGTSSVSERVEAAITAERWVDELPLDAAARRTSTLRRALAEHHQPAPAAGLDGLAGDALLDRFQEAWWVEDAETAGAALAEFERTVLEQDRTVAQQGRVLEARGLLASLTGPEEALRCWWEALELLTSAGDELRVLRTRARIGRVLFASGQPDEGLATAEEPLRWLVEHDDDPRRPGWAVNLGGMLAPKRPMEADEVLSRLRAGDLEPRNAARAALVHAQVLERLEDVPRLREALDAAIDRAALPGLDPEVPITAYARRGRLRLDEGDFAGAIADLSEARAWIAAAFGGTSPGVLIDLAIAHLNSGEPDLAAECGEQALRITSGSEDPHQTLIPRRILADAYQAAGSWGLALEQVRALQAIEPPERQPSLLEQEGDMLERTGQEREAVEKFLGAADGYGELGARVEEARCFRRAAESALWTDDPERAAELRGRAAALLDGLDEPEAVYHRAGLLLDEAVQHDYLGQPELGVPLLDRACDLFRSIGAEQAAQNCLLRRGEAGALPEEHVLREIHEQSREGSPFWRRSGYLLVTLLERDGRTAEAQDLQSRVQPGESWER